MCLCIVRVCAPCRAEEAQQPCYPNAGRMRLFLFFVFFAFRFGADCWILLTDLAGSFEKKMYIKNKLLRYSGPSSGNAMPEEIGIAESERSLKSPLKNKLSAHLLYLFSPPKSTAAASWRRWEWRQTKIANQLLNGCDKFLCKNYCAPPWRLPTITLSFFFSLHLIPKTDICWVCSHHSALQHLACSAHYQTLVSWGARWWAA